MEDNPAKCKLNIDNRRKLLDEISRSQRWIEVHPVPAPVSYMHQELKKKKTRAKPKTQII
jgi:hypothetical protein